MLGKILTPTFMANHKISKGLMTSILFASIIISASLIFFGMQVAGTDVNEEDLQAAISLGIDKYIEDKQNEYEDSQAAATAPVLDVDLTDDDAVLGDKDAPVTIVEFSEYQCPYCERFWAETLPELKEKYVNTGKVKFVFRDFPLNSHARAIPSSVATECVREELGDDGYYAMHDKIFENFGKLTDDDLLSFALAVGANEAAFVECYADERFVAEAQADLQDGAKYGVTGTPAFFVNGQRLVGAQPFAAFEELIEAELAK